MKTRTERVELLDVVSIRRSQLFHISVPPQTVARVVVPLIWLTKANTVSSPADLGVATARDDQLQQLGTQESRTNFTEFTLRKTSGAPLFALPRSDTDLLVRDALLEIALAMHRLRNRRSDFDIDDDTRAKVAQIVAGAAPPALEAFRELLTGADDVPDWLAATLASPVVFASFVEAVFGTPLLLQLDAPVEMELDLTYVTTQVWQTRTTRASFGIEPMGLGLDVPRIGLSEAYTLEIVKPLGCEILGCQLKADVETPDGSRPSTPAVYARKAARRSLRRVLSEKLRARNLVFRSQERTRFARHAAVPFPRAPRFSRATATIWLSFERRSIRPPMMGLSIVFAVLLFLLGWVQVSGGPGFSGGGWHWYTLYTEGAVAADRYAHMTGISADAVVTALIAPGALVSIISRPSEHEVLTQLLRPIRLAVLVSASALFLGALLVAVAAPIAMFATWLTASLIAVGAAGVLLTIAYRNCERLPQRPGPWARRFIARRGKRVKRANEWLQQHHAPVAGERESFVARRRRRISEASLWQGTETGLADDSTVAGCLENAKTAVSDLERPGERTTKEPRELPFGEPATFTIRLNRIATMEAPGLASRLARVASQRQQLLAARQPVPSDPREKPAGG